MTAEWSDPLVIATMFTGVMLLGSVIALMGSLFALKKQIRKEREDVKNSTYERIRSDFSNFSLFLADRPGIVSYIENNADPNNKQFENQAKSYFDGLLGLFERTWYARDTIGDQQWNNWKDWLDHLMNNPAFKEVVKKTEKFYDKDFIRMVKELESFKKNDS